MRSLSTYSLSDLYDLEAQGLAVLPTLQDRVWLRMVHLVAAIKGEIADRRGQENLAALATGYDDHGELLDAKHSHQFARVQGRRG